MRYISYKFSQYHWVVSKLMVHKIESTLENNPISRNPFIYQLRECECDMENTNKNYHQHSDERHYIVIIKASVFDHCLIIAAYHMMTTNL